MEVFALLRFSNSSKQAKDSKNGHPIGRDINASLSSVNMQTRNQFYHSFIIIDVELCVKANYREKCAKTHRVLQMEDVAVEYFNSFKLSFVWTRGARTFSAHRYGCLLGHCTERRNTVRKTTGR